MPFGRRDAFLEPIDPISRFRCRSREDCGMPCDTPLAPARFI
jgi:hypothetical protein